LGFTMALTLRPPAEVEAPQTTEEFNP
jgi:hypothetical protein